MDIHLSPDPRQLAGELADYLASRITAVIRERGLCHLSLAGGCTPIGAYEQLRFEPLEWEKVHFWFGDERCLPAGDRDRNDTMIRAELLSHLPINEAQVHPIRAEVGTKTAACEYSRALHELDAIDIALLGMGEDGHTASLFPGNAALSLNSPAVPVFDAPKYPAERVSLSLPTLQKARERIVLATGSKKAATLAHIVDGKQFPVTMIGPAKWFVDAAASAEMLMLPD